MDSIYILQASSLSLSLSLSPLNLHYGFFKKSIKVWVSKCFMLIEMLIYIKN